MKTRIRKLFGWETMLVVLLILLCCVFAVRDNMNVASRAYKNNAFTFVTIINGMQPYFLYSFMTLGVMMVLALGDIDISVGASGALSASAMFVAYGAMTEAGMAGMPAFIISVVICIATGALCGLFNGLLVTRFKELFPMIITLSTQLFFRGLCYLLLGGNTISYSKDPVFDTLKGLSSTVSAGGVRIPVILFWFLAFAAVFFIILQLMPAGRKLLASGTNPVTSRYSGIRVDRVKIIVFTITGIMSAVSALFYASSASRSIRADAMEGYEMYAIAAAVLGGFSTSGGHGNVVGVVISLVIFGVLKKGMGTVFGMPDSTVNLAVGVVLILCVLLPNVYEDIGTARRLRRQHAEVEQEEKAREGASA